MYRKGNLSSLSKCKFGAATKEDIWRALKKLKLLYYAAAPPLCTLLKRANTLIGKDMHPDVQ